MLKMRSIFFIISLVCLTSAKGLSDCVKPWNMCDGNLDCKDGEDEDKCPNCKEGLRVKICDADGTFICEDQLCNGACLTSNRKVCNEECILNHELCNNTCDSDSEYPLICKGEISYCIHPRQSCYGKCITPQYPILVPFTRSGLCTSRALCIPEGPIVDQAHYMCNEMCIPAFIACNDTCLDSVLWRTNRREELIGPVVCKEVENLRAIKYADFVNSNDTLGNNFKTKEGSWKTCLPGGFACNGTCSVDRRLPLKKKGRRGDDECTASCHRVREWPCGGNCVDNEEPCEGKCKEGKFMCQSGDECVYESSVCNGYSTCKDGSDEEGCPICDENSKIVCDGKPACKHTTPMCNGECTSFWYSNGEWHRGWWRCGEECIPADEPCQGECARDYQWPCSDSSKCISSDKINDGEEDCSNGSDEKIFFDINLPRNFENQQLWLCGKDILNYTEPCKGKCRDGWKPCGGQCIDGKLKCLEDDGCGCGYDWVGNENSETEGECRNYFPAHNCKTERNESCMFDEVWLCDGEVICSETPCKLTEEVLCPSEYYLCGSLCLPEFVSCNKTCREGGLLCENPDSQVAFSKFYKKRYTHSNFKLGLKISVICTKLYKIAGGVSLGLDEFCCLPLSSQCDGILECVQQNNSTDEDQCDGCMNGLGICEGKKTCLDRKCGGQCQEGLKNCKYGGESLIQCAPSFGGFGKSESSRIDCMDWTRRAANLPDIFASCGDYGCGPAHLLTKCDGRAKESLDGPC